MNRVNSRGSSIIATLYAWQGFRNQVHHVEHIFCGPQMLGLKALVANLCVTNSLSFWGACGSVVSVGRTWTLESRESLAGVETFGMLGPSGQVVFEDKEPCRCLDTWQITYGTSACIVSTEMARQVAAFRTVGQFSVRKTFHSQLAARITAKMQIQGHRLARTENTYRWASERGLVYRWRLYWGVGLACIEF